MTKILSLEEGLERILPVGLMQNVLFQKFNAERPERYQAKNFLTNHDSFTRDEKDLYGRYSQEDTERAETRLNDLIKEKTKAMPRHAMLKHLEKKEYEGIDKSRLHVDMFEFLEAHRASIMDPSKIYEYITVSDSGVADLIKANHVCGENDYDPNIKLVGKFLDIDNTSIRIAIDEGKDEEVSEYIKREIIEPFFEYVGESTAHIMFKGTKLDDNGCYKGMGEMTIDLDRSYLPTSIHIAQHSMIDNEGDLEKNLLAHKGLRTVLEGLAKCPYVNRIECGMGTLVPTYVRE